MEKIMKQEHIDYLEAQRGNYESVQHGFVRNLDIDILNMYEHIYREYLDPNFVLTKWCSDCVMDMIKRLYYNYDLIPKAVVEEVKKRGRPKK
jgi:hypothetical protein